MIEYPDMNSISSITIPQCPFVPGNQCKRNHTLKALSDSVEGVLSPAELFKEVCQNSNPEAYTQCPAFNELSQYGSGSGRRR